MFKDTCLGPVKVTAQRPRKYALGDCSMDLEQQKKYQEQFIKH